jgi:nicotinamidase/pyrazinamidase
LPDNGASGVQFNRTRLAQLLRDENVKEVWVGGLATDYCVKQTVIDGIRNGFKVKALADAMRAVNVNPDDGQKAIEEMKEAGAEIVGDEEKAAGMGR